MRINSKNMFKSVISNEKRLNSIEKRISLKEKKLLESDKSPINVNKFFEDGYKKGMSEGIEKGFIEGQTKGYELGTEKGYEAGYEEGLSVEGRAEGGPVVKGKPYLVGEEGKETYVPSPYFEGSIGRNTDNNIVTELFFDTGKGRSSDFYEEKTSDGTTLFRDETKLIGSSMMQSSYQHTPTITEKYEDGGAETFTETENYSSRISSIAKDDLIEHQDQLLGEIHKIKGFEDVTINDVIRGTTGLPKDTMFNILSNSDASFATAARTEEQNRMPTDYLVSGEDSYRSESQMTYNSEGVQPSQENNQFASLADSINQSVNKPRVQTVIQPVIQTKTKQIPTPMPMGSSTQVVQVSKSKLPQSIAKMIN